MLIKKTLIFNDDDFSVLVRVAQNDNRSASYIARDIFRAWVESLPASVRYDKTGNDKLKNRN